MSIFRKILIAALCVCMTVCAGIAIAACDNGAGIINPNKNAYTITLNSQGGLPLQGVAVALAQDGKEITEKTLTDSKGQAVFPVSEFGEYEVVIDDVPAGYTVSAGSRTKTKANDQTLLIRFNSAIIDSPAPAGTRYNIGSVMYDFTFKDALTGEEFNLIETMKEKKAVLLNFWGTQCGPCRSEFPAMQEAYKKYVDKIEIFALSSYAHLDTESQIATFKEQGEYTFPMGLDHGTGTAQVYSCFDMSGGYPTSVIVDRYGVVAYKSSGSETSVAAWEAIFDRYTKDDYTQIDGVVDENNDLELIARPENVTHPDSAAIAQAVNGDGIGDKLNEYFFDENYEYDWYWDVANVDGRSVLTPNGCSTDYTFSSIYFTVNLKPGEAIKYDYNVDTLSQRNILNVFVNGKRIVQHYESSGGWQTNDELFLATKVCTVEVGFLYLKAGKVEKNTPVYIDNISVYDARNTGSTRDLAFSPVEGLTTDKNGKYGVNIELGDDDIYYYNYTTISGKTEKAMLFADLTGVTYWAERHLNNPTFQTETINTQGLVTNTRDSSVHNIYTWYLNQSFEYEGTNYNMTYNNAYYIQIFSETGYVPVTKQFKETLYTFTKYAYEIDYKKACGQNNVFNKDEWPNAELKLTDDWYEDQWLELCYYFMHFGPAHAAGDECFVNFNTAKGLTFDQAYEAQLGENKINITKMINLSYDPLNAGGGLKFTFKPKVSGLYLFYSTHDGKDEAVDSDGNYIGVDPDMAIYDLATGKVVAENNNDNRYNKIGGVDFFTYANLKAGVTYGITACMNYYQDTGKYTMHIEKSEQDHVEILESCAFSTFSTWYSDKDGNPTDPNGNPSDTFIYYLDAIKTVYNTDTGYYYEYRNGGGFGNVIYINFLGSNYYWTSGHSLYNAITAENSPINNQATIEILKKYYEKSITGKDVNDELYGFVEASSELVNALTSIFEDPVDRDWERFACYYVEYNA